MATLLQNILETSFNATADAAVIGPRDLPALDAPPVDDVVVSIARPPAVSDATVDETLRDLCRRVGDSERSDVVREEDEVLVDLVGYAGGEYVPQSAQTSLTLGPLTDAGFPGLRTSLVGTRVGATTAVKVTFPDDHPAQVLRGVIVVYGVTVRGACRRTPARPDSAAVLAAVGARAPSEVRGKIRDALAAVWTHVARRDAEQAAIDAWAARAKISISEKLARAAARERWLIAEGEALKANGAPLEDQAAAFERFVSAEPNRRAAQTQVRSTLALAALARAEAISLRADDVEQAWADYAARAGGSEAAARADLRGVDEETRAQLAFSLTLKKARELVLSHARFVDT